MTQPFNTQRHVLRLLAATCCLLLLGSASKPCNVTTKSPEPAEPTGADDTGGEPAADSTG